MEREREVETEGRKREGEGGREEDDRGRWREGKRKDRGGEEGKRDLALRWTFSACSDFSLSWL